MVYPARECLYLSRMTSEWRKLTRISLWCLLVFCLFLDGVLGEGAISGCCDVGYVDEYGRRALPGPEPRLWIPIVGLVLLQAAMIAALIRLRPNPRVASVFKGVKSV